MRRGKRKKRKKKGGRVRDKNSGDRKETWSMERDSRRGRQRDRKTKMSRKRFVNCEREL